jgi:hypothetical protein
MEAGWTPKLESCRCSQKAMGFEMSTAMVKTEVGLHRTATRYKMCLYLLSAMALHLYLLLGIITNYNNLLLLQFQCLL